nr:VTT domain-containing protein [Actinoplanes solisilvae]
MPLTTSAGEWLESRVPDTTLVRDHAELGDTAIFYAVPIAVLARFVPIVRTFTPVVAGASHMPYRTFVLFNLVGGVLWGCGVTILGYFLGQIAFVRSNIELILIGIVVVSVVPVAIAALRGRLRRGARRRG